ncbi:MAG: phosphotransferase [Chitinophagaceae bacterium]|nr:phosphotransferase [Chitinophagaceae bacterium]
MTPTDSPLLKHENIISVEPIPGAGSDRKYYRIQTAEGKFIFCRNENVAENESFFYFARHFYDQGIPVPKLMSISEDRKEYLQEDAGQLSLLDVVMKEGHTESVFQLYERSLSQLARMQLEAGASIDFQNCFASKQFDAQAILADLNYFKYYFLDLQKIPYNKTDLQQEFEALAKSLSTGQESDFMYRDFQGRNILVREQQPVFIDFQGGMQGPVLYDVASLLWQAKAALPVEWKEKLYAYYITCVSSYRAIDHETFDRQYQGLVLVRLLQVLGAYGLRGLIEHKPHFKSSIPQGLANISEWLSAYSLHQYPILLSVLHQISGEDFRKKFIPTLATVDSPLTIKVYSFSYKKGLPQDHSGNGGGFVFDCRGVLNPGRFDEYKKLTGRDQPVIDFLESKTRIAEFLQAAQQSVSISIEDYLARGFEHLMISFGCTGGQHRSVYCADAMAKYLRATYHVKVEVKHCVQEEKNWIN